ncbi:hypothetical protein JCM19233_2926 [Vibrio astriarenae]|nr:hypothetical protein JCM19233_2926 [Vibrio sp. C7]
MLSKLKDLYGRIFINQAKTPLPIPELDVSTCLLPKVLPHWSLKMLAG